MRNELFAEHREEVGMKSGEETWRWMQVLPWGSSNLAPSWMVRCFIPNRNEVHRHDTNLTFK